MARYGLNVAGRAGSHRDRARRQGGGRSLRGRPPIRPRRAPAGKSAHRHRGPRTHPHSAASAPESASNRSRAQTFARNATAPNAPPIIPLGEVATINIAPGPNQISRENGKRRVVVTANVRGRDLGSFVQEAQQTIQRTGQNPRRLLDRRGAAQFEQLISASQAIADRRARRACCSSSCCSS